MSTSLLEEGKDSLENSKNNSIIDSQSVCNKNSQNSSPSSLNVSFEDIPICLKDSEIKKSKHKHSSKTLSTAINTNINKENIILPNSFYNFNEDVSLESYNNNFEGSINEFVVNLNNYFVSEKSKICEDEDKLYKKIKGFIEDTKREYSKIEEDKIKIRDNNKLILDNLLLKTKEDIIELEIDGSYNVTTTRQTLTKYPNSLLYKMFTPENIKFQPSKKDTDIIQLNRNPKIFKNLLYYLRTDKIPNLIDKKDYHDFYNELDYWQIPFPNNKRKTNHQNCQEVDPNNPFKSQNIHHSHTKNHTHKHTHSHTHIHINQSSPFSFDSKWCASTLLIQESTTKHSQNKHIKKKAINHGIVFCTPSLSKANNFIEFKVTIKKKCKGNSNLFIGVVEKSKYKPENLLSTFWRDSPSSCYWDVWNNKLIKINQNGVQKGLCCGYGCKCQSNTTYFGIKYNDDNSLAFFKDGANLGVAFSNVGASLTPSLDLWFEEGEVEIVNKYGCKGFKDYIF